MCRSRTVPQFASGSTDSDRKLDCSKMADLCGRHRRRRKTSSVLYISMLPPAAGLWYCPLLLVSGTAPCCWSLVLPPAAGLWYCPLLLVSGTASCCWSLVLPPAAGLWYCPLLLVSGTAPCCWSLVLPPAAGLWYCLLSAGLWYCLLSAGLWYCLLSADCPYTLRCRPAEVNFLLIFFVLFLYSQYRICPEIKQHVISSQIRR